MSGRQDRPTKRLRRLSTDSEGGDEALDWTVQPAKGPQATSSKNEMSRPSRRAASGAGTPSMATVSRGPAPASSTSPQSMRLTVKLPAGKLREATRAGVGSSIIVNSRDQFVGGEIMEGRRARNVKKSYVLPESESEDEDEEMEDVGDEDAEGEDEDDEMDGLSDEDADGDVDMDVPPPPPKIKISKAQTGKTTISAKPAGKSDGKSVEQKELEADSDDDDLSSVGSMEEDEEDQQEVGEEDVEGEDDDEEVEVEVEVEEEEEEEEENPFGSDDEDTPAAGSRGSTPDIAKMTARQRAKLEEGGAGHLMALPDEVQVKKHLTAEEHAMRRAEMARRRKNLSEKRNEEEKMETINKLLKKQAPKTNARRKEFAGSGAGESTPDQENSKPDPIFARWVSNRDGNRVGIPAEWLDGPAGEMFGNSVKATGTMTAGKMVQEIEDVVLSTTASA